VFVLTLMLFMFHAISVPLLYMTISVADGRCEIWWWVKTSVYFQGFLIAGLTAKSTPEFTQVQSC